MGFAHESRWFSGGGDKSLVAYAFPLINDIISLGVLFSISQVPSLLALEIKMAKLFRLSHSLIIDCQRQNVLSHRYSYWTLVFLLPLHLEC